MADFDLRNVPADQLVAFYGLYFAAAAADGSVEKEEMLSIFGILEIDHLPKERQDEVRAFIATPPEVSDCFDTLRSACDELRFAVVVGTTEVLLADELVTDGERELLHSVCEKLNVTKAQADAIENFVKESRRVQREGLDNNAAEQAIKGAAGSLAAVGIPIAAVYFSGSVVGLSAAGITSGLAALGLGMGMVPGIGIAILLDEVETGVDLLPDDVLESWDDDLAKLDAIYRSRQEAVRSATSRLEFRSWDQFVRDSAAYCMAHDLDILLPYTSFLTEENLAALKREDYAAQYRWDKWDYVVVGTAGVLAALTDFLLVRVPTRLSSSGEVLRTMTYNGKDYTGSPITAFLQKHINTTEGSASWFANWARHLEETCTVPYDVIRGSGVDGIAGRTHRLQTLGHDPILGFVFGILDILRGTITGFSYDKLAASHEFVLKDIGAPEATSLIEAFLKQFGHLLSDVGTPSGLAPPLFALLQRINVSLPTSPKGRTVGEVARWMYLNGYDLRHFIASGLTPGIIELVVRGTAVQLKAIEDQLVRYITRAIACSIFCK